MRKAPSVEMFVSEHCRSTTSPIDPLVGGKIVGEAVRPVQLVRFARQLPPLLALKRGKLGVAGKLAVDFCQIQEARERQRRAIKILATDNEHWVRQTRKRDSVFQC